MPVVGIDLLFSENLCCACVCAFNPPPLTPAPTFTGPKSVMSPRSIQVNSLNMQGATHLEAVTALRNAGSCIMMKVLRERLLPREVSVLDDPQDPPDVMSRQLCSQDGGGQRSKQPKTESTEDCLSKKIEAVVCNGNGIVGGLLKSLQKQSTILNQFRIIFPL